MVNMKIIWETQIELCQAIAKDIIKHNASKEVLEHAKKFAEIAKVDCENFIRINYGEAYAYVEIIDSKITGNIYWNNDEMGIAEKYSSSYIGSIKALNKMTIKEAYQNCQYPEEYDDKEGLEKTILAYIPMEEIKKELYSDEKFQYTVIGKLLMTNSEIKEEDLKFAKSNNSRSIGWFCLYPNTSNEDFIVSENLITGEISVTGNISALIPVVVRYENLDTFVQEFGKAN